MPTVYACFRSLLDGLVEDLPLSPYFDDPAQFL